MKLQILFLSMIIPICCFGMRSSGKDVVSRGPSLKELARNALVRQTRVPASDIEKLPLELRRFVLVKVGLAARGISVIRIPKYTQDLFIDSVKCCWEHPLVYNDDAQAVICAKCRSVLKDMQYPLEGAWLLTPCVSLATDERMIGIGMQRGRVGGYSTDTRTIWLSGFHHIQDGDQLVAVDGKKKLLFGVSKVNGKIQTWHDRKLKGEYDPRLVQPATCVSLDAQGKYLIIGDSNNMVGRLSVQALLDKEEQPLKSQFTVDGIPVQVAYDEKKGRYVVGLKDGRLLIKIDRPSSRQEIVLPYSNDQFPARILQFNKNGSWILFHDVGAQKLCLFSIDKQISYEIPLHKLGEFISLSATFSEKYGKVIAQFLNELYEWDVPFWKSIAEDTD